MTELFVIMKSSLTLVYVSVTQWEVHTLHSFEVDDFFGIFGHKFIFCVVDSAFFVHYAFVAEVKKFTFLL